jgi:hypothetical protein
LRILDQQSVPNHETTDEADEVAIETIDEVAMTDEAVEDIMTGEAVMTDEEAEDLVVLAVVEAVIEMVDEVVDEMTEGGRGPGVMIDEDKKI